MMVSIVGGVMEHCGSVMAQERARQYLETRYECGACRYLIAVDDSGNIEILREG
jgi:hypothetical protein